MNNMLRRPAALAVILILLVTVALVSAATIAVNGSGAVSTSQLGTGRIFRDGNASGCSPAKTFPGAYSTGSSFGYTVEGPFGPVAVDSCITVTWTGDHAGFNVHPVAFLNGFNPTFAANAANYLGDAGSSTSGSFSFPVSAGDTFVLVFQNASSVQAVDYTYAFSYPGVDDEGDDDEGINEPETPAPIEVIDDGRLNRLDIGARLAVYPVSYGDGFGLHLYAINDQGRGYLVLEVTPAMIAAVPELPTENVLIASTPDGSVTLYRLFTGEFQVNAAPDYAIVFRQLTTTADYYHP